MHGYGIGKAATRANAGGSEVTDTNATPIYHIDKRAATTAAIEGAPARDSSVAAPSQELPGTCPATVSHIAEVGASKRDSETPSADDLLQAIRFDCGLLQAKRVERRAAEFMWQRLIAASLRRSAELIAQGGSLSSADYLANVELRTASFAETKRLMDAAYGEGGEL